MKIDKKIIKELSDYLDEFNLNEIEYSENNITYKIKKSEGKIYQQIKSQVFDNTVASENKSSASNKDSKNIIKSPMVGTVYLAPEPGEKPFISVGSKIKKGQSIMIIEAMKTMNHVPSTLDGVVKKIFVNNGEAVEFDQDLILVE